VLWTEQGGPHCARRSVTGYDHAPERHWRHLNVCQWASASVCALPRGPCRECRKGFTVRAPWEGRSRGFPQEFEAFALTLRREMPVQKAGAILGGDDQRLWRMLFAPGEAAWAELNWEQVVWVGADERNRRKGHHYLTGFVDWEAQRVLLAVEGKAAGVWERFAQQWLAHNGHPRAIPPVAIDLSPASSKGVREHRGNAIRVDDKYHVVSAVVAAVVAVRRAETRQDAVARAALEPRPWLWRKNPERWTERAAQRWEQRRDKPRVTGRAYALRLELPRAYAAKTVAPARRRFEAGCPWVGAEATALASGLLEPMRPAAEMVSRHLDGILGHWKPGLTTAFVEGLNRLFSATKRKARGDRTSEYPIAMLYCVAGKLEIPSY
jgi:transposase